MRRVLTSRWLPGLVAGLLTILALVPGIATVPAHPDEDHYAYSGAYFTGLLVRGDFRIDRPDPTTDPGWNPYGYWALTQPMGVRLLYGAVLAATGEPAPAQAWNYSGTVPPLDTQLAPDALHVLRLTALLCAAIGFGLLAARCGWIGVAAAALLLAIPDVRADLVRAWAEGPLLLGVGLVASTLGRRGLGAACAVAATFKLTALVFWPLLFLPRWGGRHRGQLAVCLAIWTLLTPPSWFRGGPFYLVPMLVQRDLAFTRQSALVGTPWHEGLGGWFLPSRYLWPIELLGALALSAGFAWLWQRRGMPRFGLRWPVRGAHQP